MLVATLLAALTLFPGGDAPTLAATPAPPGGVRVDGRLDEPAWATAPVASGFRQQRPNAGEAASEATDARVLIGADAVYVGMRMHDRDAARIDARLARRDASVDSDWAHVALDSYGEGRTAFFFGISAGGVKLDGLLYNDTNQDNSWDAVWDAEVTRDAGGWTAEFRIPLSQLRFAANQAGATWGLQFGRDIQRTGETAFWAPILPSESGFVSRFGQLTGIAALAAPRRVEVLPYVATAVTRAPGDAADPFFRATDASPRAGLDLKLGLTGDLTLTAAVNPDFGQVEADPAQVNLGGFELFLEERRPFFVEGADIFSFGRTRTFSTSYRPTLLYTRRIGRAPQRGGFVPGDVHDAVDAAGGSLYTQAPDQTPILGAAKVSGRLGRFALGVLSAVTGTQYGRYEAFDGTGGALADGRAAIEPPTAYGVARARTTFGPTTVGAAGTLVARSLSDDALAELLPRDALLGAVDAEHRLSPNWIVSGVLAGSRVGGSAASITSLQNAFPRVYDRPDADHLSVDTTATSLSGLWGEFSIQRDAGRWLHSFTAAFTTPGFDANALGFQSRADVVTFNALIDRNQPTPMGPFRRWEVWVGGGASANFDGDRIGTWLGSGANGQFRNFWGGNLNLNLNPRTTDDRLTRGGPLAESPAYLWINGNVYTDSRKPVSGYFWNGTGRTEIGGWSYAAETGATIRPSTALSIDVGPFVEWDFSPRQYVAALDAPEATSTFGRRYVFAELMQTTASMSIRADWTFTPRLTLQGVLRPFVSTGRYERFKQLTEPGQLRFPVYGEDLGSVEALDGGGVRITPGDGGEAFELSPDFAVRAVQGNAVLRWEWRPGSALFVVWQHTRDGFDPDGRFRFGPALRGLATDTPTNVFLVKLSYWLG